MQMRFRSAALVLLVLTATIGVVQAGPKPKPAVVSFTFDDGKPTVFANAFPVLAARDYPATMYVITGELGTVDWHITVEQARMLQQHRWEIGSHTATHPNLAKITPVTVLGELEKSRDRLRALGFPNASFASPFGEVNPTVLQLIRQTYRSHRYAWGNAVTGGLNPVRGFDPYDIHALEVTRETTLATVTTALDRAVKEQKWLVLLFHHVTEGHLEHQTQASANLFREIVKAVAARSADVEVMTIGDQVATNGKR